MEPRGEVNATVVVKQLVAPGVEQSYDEFLADVWVGVVLTLMVLSCVCCVCSCLLYHKFMQWKRRVLVNRARAARAMEAGDRDEESLPSYTLVSGLPSYDEALEQLRAVREQCKMAARAPEKKGGAPQQHQQHQQQPPPPTTTLRLSVAEFLRTYKTYPPL
ncbi:protein commissureless 2 homolog [Bacillus rossius redtenbacheri]|uniref:protein commissureless 2 homolog n=1 Tax=Bacillus rossius redtenbacheri TaxID=93214 RepID=UPI002FDE74D5